MLYACHILLVLTSIWSFAMDAEDTRPQCNWAQDVNIIELQSDVALQDNALQNASYWGGAFAARRIGMSYEYGRASAIELNFTTGIPIAPIMVNNVFLHPFRYCHFVCRVLQRPALILRILKKEVESPRHIHARGLREKIQNNDFVFLSIFLRFTTFLS
jgi:hypothetical protein